MESDGELECKEEWVLCSDAMRSIEAKIDIRTW
jgi:hypothetical protein